MSNSLRSRKRFSLQTAGILCLLCGLGLTRFAAPIHAQDGPETDGNEVEFWTTGGHGTNGITQHTSVWTAGFRYGWVITAPHGPGLLRGRFEYAVDAVPVFMIFQPTNTAYGAAVNPFALIWDFDTHGRIVPYLDLGGGVLSPGSDSRIPRRSSRATAARNGGCSRQACRCKQYPTTPDTRPGRW